jgi:hypothetical protein
VPDLLYDGFGTFFFNAFSSTLLQKPPPRPPGLANFDSIDDCIPAHARSACEQHRPWIEEQVSLGRNTVAIYQDLVELFAFEHKYNSVKRFCRALRKKSTKQSSTAAPVCLDDAHILTPMFQEGCVEVESGSLGPAARGGIPVFWRRTPYVVLNIGGHP